MNSKFIPEHDKARTATVAVLGLSHKTLKFGPLVDEIKPIKF